MNKLIIAIDFDKTIVNHNDDYKITGLLPGAKEVINWLYELGHYIIIWTCRSGDYEKEAKRYLDDNGIKYHKINENYEDLDFETGRKIFYDILIDDKNLGLKIDWVYLKQLLKETMIEKLVKEIINIKNASGAYFQEPLMQRGLPNEDGDNSPDMGEAVQKMYDGIEDTPSKRYDQLSIMDDSRDWIDDEVLLHRLRDERANSLDEKRISSVLEDKIEELENFTDIQCNDGNWNYDPYMHGMANGMLFSLSLLKDEEPKYLDAPDKWLSKKEAKIKKAIYTDEWDPYINPKGVGEHVPMAIMAPNEKIIQDILKTPLTYRPYIKKRHKYHRDETQKYLTVDDDLENQMYWQQDGLHRTKGI